MRLRSISLPMLDVTYRCTRCPCIKLVALSSFMIRQPAKSRASSNAAHRVHGTGGVSSPWPVVAVMRVAFVHPAAVRCDVVLHVNVAKSRHDLIVASIVRYRTDDADRDAAMPGRKMRRLLCTARAPVEKVRCVRGEKFRSRQRLLGRAEIVRSLESSRDWV